MSAELALGEIDVRRMACRTLLHAISPRIEPTLVARTEDYLSDRGAVGMLLETRSSGATWETVCLSYWDSRLEKNAARLEDIVTALMISVLSGVTASVIFELIKTKSALFAKGATVTLTTEQLKALIVEGVQAGAKLQALYILHRHKEIASSEAQTAQSSQLYEHLKNGGALEGYVQEAGLPQTPLPKQLQFAPDIARGVVETEVSRKLAKSPTFVYHRALKGLSFSAGLGFGEVVSLLPDTYPDTDTLASLEAIKRGHELIRANRLYPQLWPDVETSLPSPKVLILCNSQARDALHLMHLSAGLIAVDGGMTSHIAVTSRGMGTAAMRVSDMTLEDAQRSKFALFNDGEGSLYFDKPGLKSSDFAQLMSNSKKPINFD